LLESWNSCVQVPAWAVLVEARPDPTVVTNAALRSSILGAGLAWRVRDRSTGIEMLLVPKGSYMMGASVGDPLATMDEYPTHGITISRSFYLGRYEVTQREFASVTGYNPSYFSDGDGADGLHRPVDTVSYDEVDAFLALTGFRLPTESEWEYACRAGTQTPIYTSEGQSLADIAWCAGNSESTTHPVGTRPANLLGFHDMIGNVWEWCRDWYDGTYYANSPAFDPEGPAYGMFRVLRGGSWGSNDQNARSSFRAALWPAAVFADVGFRVARTP
jgi:formylglycine-generating enzyme required for sulfatase activity